MAPYLIASRIVTMSAKNVAPSIRPAATIIAPRMSATAFGWRAMPSSAEAARRPMPAPPPMIARPAPMPAPRYASPLGSILVLLLSRSSHEIDLVRRVRVHADEDRGEQREDVGLDEGDEQLEQHDEDREQERDRRHRYAGEPVQLTHQRDQQQERRDHHVAGQHVREQPHRE